VVPESQKHHRSARQWWVSLRIGVRSCSVRTFHLQCCICLSYECRRGMQLTVCSICMCSGLIWWVLSDCATWRQKFCTLWVTSIITSVIWWWTWVVLHLAPFVHLHQCLPLPSYNRPFPFRYMIYTVHCSQSCLHV